MSGANSVVTNGSAAGATDDGILWFGKVLRWEQPEPDRLTVRVGGREVEMLWLSAGEARQHQVAPGWRLARRPGFELDDVRGWPGPGLGRSLDAAIVRAEGWLLVPADECRRGDDYPGLAVALSGDGASFTVAQASSGFSPVYLVRPDHENGQFDVLLAAGEGRRPAVAGTITPDLSALVDAGVRDGESVVELTWTAHSNAGDALADDTTWANACRSFLADTTTNAGGSQ